MSTKLLRLLEEKIVVEKKELAVVIPDTWVAGWWLCWRLMVELSMEKSMVRWLMAKVVVAKKEKDDNEKKKGWGLIFSNFGL